MSDPTNLLNHVAPSIELMMQIIMSNPILIITALCNVNLAHLRLAR